MGYRAISWAWTVPSLSATERFILLALADSASNKDGTCWPGLDHIASMTGYSKRTIISNVQLLADRHLISIIDRRDEQGRQRTNLYRLSLPSETPSPRYEADDTCPIEPDALRVNLTHEPGETGDTSRVKLASRSLEPSEEEPSLEPSEEAAAARSTGSGLLRALERNYERAFRDVTPISLELLEGFAREFPDLPPTLVDGAFNEMAASGGRSWKYAEAILRRLANERKARSIVTKSAHQCGPICRRSGCVVVAAIQEEANT